MQAHRGVTARPAGAPTCLVLPEPSVERELPHSGCLYDCEICGGTCGASGVLSPSNGNMCIPEIAQITTANAQKTFVSKIAQIMTANAQSTCVYGDKAASECVSYDDDLVPE